MIIIFNKPYGVISQFSEHETYKSLKEFIPYKNVYPAGRLDADSEGLIILTDNGVLQNKISHPINNTYKTYWAQFENIPNDTSLDILRKGVYISDALTKPALVQKINAPTLWDREPPIRVRKSIPTCWIEIKILEGRNSQIRKMTAAISHPTLRLVRTQVGEYKLDNLQPGDYLVIKK